MASAIALLVISLGAIVAGSGYAKTARRMQSFQTTRGSVVAREVVILPSADREARWGKGGRYRPKVTFTSTVGGASYTSDRMSYALRGLRQSIAEQELAAIGGEVDVHYDPAAPEEAYLETHTPRIGTFLIAGGAVGVLIGLVMLIG